MKWTIKCFGKFDLRISVGVTPDREKTSFDEIGIRALAASNLAQPSSKFSHIESHGVGASKCVLQLNLMPPRRYHRTAASGGITPVRDDNLPHVLSVLTASYNYASFLPDALHSVRALGDHVQHVVIDDGSTDGSQDVLENWSGIDYHSFENGGLAVTLNRALRLADGEWIGWLNADDFYLPSVMAALSSCPSSVDVLFGDAVYVDADGRLIRLAARHRFSLSTLRRYGPFISPPAFFVRRSSLPSRGWDEDTIKLMDWDLYLALAHKGARFHYVPIPLGAYRIHGDQQSNAPTPRAETEAVRTRFGLDYSPARRRAERSIGGLQHKVLKLADGGYTREWRARPSVGTDMRWWRSGTTTASVSNLPTGRQRA